MERKDNPDESTLMFDWNIDEQGPINRSVEFDDETLRDGIQSPSARDPEIDRKLELLHLMDELGIHAVEVGLPAASERQRDDAKRMVVEIRDQALSIRPCCAARTLIADIDPVCRIADETGMDIELACFIGSSPIRFYAEEWDLDGVIRRTETAVNHAVQHGLSVMYVTEDTSRANPETLRRLYGTAIDCGARRLCVADTVGHSTPRGVRALMNFVRSIVEERGEPVKIDWHGHRDRGLDVANALAAVEAGADRVHGTGLGIGERCGNTPMDLLLVNCRLLGWIDNDLTRLGDYCRAVSEATGAPLPINYPVVGEDAFRTATGIHAAAVIKAKRKGDDWLADRVYSSVPAGIVGRSQRIEIGPMSGVSNILYWLQTHGLEPTQQRISALINAAKCSDRVLTEVEVFDVIGEQPTS